MTRRDADAVLSGRGLLLRRWLLAAVSVLLVLSFVEAGLRLGGWVLSRAQRAENVASIERGGELVVLCIGESTTALGGRSAYPHQLEQELRRRHPQLEVSVVNGGLARASSEQLMELLPDQLDRYRPQVVVAMMGINDGQWFAQPREPGPLGWLSSLRVVTLLRLGFEHLALRISGASPRDDEAPPESLAPWDPRRLQSPAASDVGELVRAGRMDAALDRLRRALDEEPADFAAITLLDLVSTREPASGASALAQENRLRLQERLDAPQGDPAARAAVAYIALLGGDPASAAALVLADEGGATLPEGARIELAGRCAFLATRESRVRRIDDARAYLEAGLAISPASQPGQRAKLLDQLAQLHAESGRAAEAARIRDQARQLRSNEVLPRTRASYRALRQELSARGIILVAAQYPRRPLLALRDLLGDARGLVYVDNEQSFEQAVQERGYWTVFSDQFAGDFGHLTRSGNALLARNVADALEPVLAELAPGP